MKRLNKKMKKEMLDAAFKASIIPDLVDLYSELRVNITQLAREMFAGFDFKGAEKFREYINWHKEIRIELSDADELKIFWYDGFRQLFKLEDTYCIELIGFEYPSSDTHQSYFTDVLTKRAHEIIKPYARRFYEVKAVYEDTLTLLNSVSTLDDLRKFLPSLVPYLSLEDEKPVTALVPIQRYTKINKFFKAHEPKEGIYA